MSSAISTTLRNVQQAKVWLPTALQQVRAWIDAGEDVFVEFVVRKSREQERLYHSIFRDFAKQLKHYGREMEAEDWKRLMIEAFYRATKDDPDYRDEWKNRAPRQIPNLSGDGWVEVGIESKRFTKKLATGFITFLHAWGDEQGVRWSMTSLGRDAVATIQARERESIEC